MSFVYATVIPVLPAHTWRFLEDRYKSAEVAGASRRARDYGEVQEMSLTFYISKEADDGLRRRIDYLRKLGSRLDKCTQSAIQSEVRWIAMLSAVKPDDWTLSHLDGIIRTVLMIDEAGL